MEEEHARLKAEYDKLSQNTKGLYQAHRDEHIRISGLFCLKIGAVVMLVSVLTQMATVVLEGYGTQKNWRSIDGKNCRCIESITS